MNCPKCHFRNPSDAKFCGKCGDSIVTLDTIAHPAQGYNARESAANKTKRGFGDSIKLGFIRYFEVRGRSSRSEYWWWILFTTLVWIAFGLIDSILFLITQDVIFLFGPLRILFVLAIIVPCIALAVRRLHDLNRSGWWLVIPLTGWVVFIIPGIILSLLLLTLFCKKGDERENRYGSRYNYIPNA